MAIPDNPALNCDDCSACCLNFGNPPFLLDLKAIEIGGKWCSELFG